MKIVSLLSGGLDSTTMLYRFKNEGHELLALSMNYGQRHIKELEKAKLTCSKLNIEHLIINLPIWHTASALSNINKIMPEGHYQNENMKQTVVANRNMILLSLAIGIAIDREYDAVAYAAHSGDHAIYPDCRPKFIEAMKKVSSICDYKSIKILTPYMAWNKISILDDGKNLGVDYNLTWTCYKGEEKPCGKCGACQEREEAFRINNIQDPLLKIA